MLTAEQYLQKADEMDARACACSGAWEREAYRRIARHLRTRADRLKRAAKPGCLQPDR